MTANIIFGDLSGSSANSSLDVTFANLSLVLEVGSSSYWNLTKAFLAITYNNKTVPTDLNTDITPQKFGYTNQRSDAVCGAGYGLCAPNGLSWTCYDQVLAANMKTVENDTFATFLSIP